MPRDIAAGFNAPVTKLVPQSPMPTNRAEKLRQIIAQYERLSEGATPELAAVYAAEIAAIRRMLARIEAAAADPSVDQGTGLQGKSIADPVSRKAKPPN